MQPLVLSPKVWMCMPRLALASWPEMSQVTVVGADSDSCSKVTVPETLESPRTTATRRRAHVSDLLVHRPKSSCCTLDAGFLRPETPLDHSGTDGMPIKVAAEADRVLGPSIPDASRSVGRPLDGGVDSGSFLTYQP